MRKCGLVVCLSLIFLFGISQAKAAELIYTPINPSFGGSPLNAQWLSSSAQAQNDFREEPIRPFHKDPLERFKESLRYQILSRLAIRIVDEAFGKEAFSPGRYEIGDYLIDVTTDGVKIKVVITDPETGGTTTIEVPYYKNER